jgi:hypothetical protein
MPKDKFKEDIEEKKKVRVLKLAERDRKDVRLFRRLLIKRR